MVNGKLTMVYSRYKWWFYGDLTKMINGDLMGFDFTKMINDD